VLSITHAYPILEQFEPGIAACQHPSAEAQGTPIVVEKAAYANIFPHLYMHFSSSSLSKVFSLMRY